MKYEVGKVVTAHYAKGNISNTSDYVILYNENNMIDNNIILGLCNLSNMKRSEYLIDPNTGKTADQLNQFFFKIIEERIDKSINRDKNIKIEDSNYLLNKVIFKKKSIHYESAPILIESFKDDILRYRLIHDPEIKTLVMKDNLCRSLIPFGIQFMYISKLYE